MHTPAYYPLLPARPAMFQRFPLFIVAALGIIALNGCAPSHRLAEAPIQGQAVAVAAPVPPGSVVRGPWPPTVGRSGGMAERRISASEQARNRLESAAAHVDMPELIAARGIIESAETLNFRVAEDIGSSRYVLDVRVFDVHFHSRHFEAPIQFTVDMEVMLFETSTEDVMWTRRIRERGRMTADMFGLEGTRTISAQTMTNLTEDQYIQGLYSVAYIAGESIANRLARDYSRVR